MNTKILRRSTVLYSSIAFLIFLNSCNHKNDSEEQVSAERVDIPTFVLHKEEMSTSLNIPGELIAYQQVDLYAKVSSFVKTLNVDIGSEVKKGQLLMTLEAPEISSQLAAAESRLKSQEALYTASKSMYDRLLETSKTPGTISTNDLEQAIARRNSDMAQLNAARAVFKEVGATMAYLEIRAPFDGIVSARNVNLGAFVGPTASGSALPIFIIQDQKQLRLVVSISEIYTGFLKTGDEVKFSVRSKPNDIFTAKVKRLSGALDSRLRSERIEMDVPNLNKKLLPGMVAEVAIPLPANVSSFIVPKTAIVDGPEGVYVIRSTNKKAEIVNIKKGRSTDDKIEIFGNISDGDLLVTQVSEEIHEGDPIKP